MSPRRIYWTRFEGKLPAGAKSIARPSRWGNPYRIGDPHPQHGQPMTRDDVVDLFGVWIRQPQQQHLRIEARKSLAGHDLACSCPEGGRCHGDVWLALLAEPGDDPDEDPGKS